jgi:hypothetical protein
MKVNCTNEMLDHVIATIRRWPDFAHETGVTEDRIRLIQAAHRLSILKLGKSTKGNLTALLPSTSYDRLKERSLRQAQPTRGVNRLLVRQINDVADKQPLLL